MALYDLTRIDWSNGTCNLDNIYYAGGFSNTLFFPEDMTGPQYGIESDNKKAYGLNNAKRQVWAKKNTLTVKHIESVADILSILPMHDTVTFTDKEGNAYVCAGADIEIDIQPEGDGEAMGDRNKYPIMIIEIVFNAHQIIKTGCCNTSIAAVTCSDTLPTIDTVTEPSAGTMLITGTAPTGHQVRLYQRELFEQINAEIGGKVNDVCWAGTTLAYCCTNAGKIYKSIDSGNTWALVYNGSTALMCCCWDGVSTVYFGGENDGVDSELLYTNNGGASWNEIVTGAYDTINSIDASAVNEIVMCTSSGKVLYYNGSLTDVSPAGAGVLRDIVINKDLPSIWMVVGTNFYAYTEDSGANWTTYVTAIDMYCVSYGIWNSTANGIWLFGDSNGNTYTTSDNGANISLKAVFSSRCCGLSRRVYSAAIRFYACDVNGNVKYTDDNGSTWSTGYKIKSVSTCNRIRAYATADMKILVAIGNGKVASTETGLDAVVPVVLGSEYAGSGITYNAVNNVSYQLQVQSLTFTTDPCQNSTITIFTT